MALRLANLTCSPRFPTLRGLVAPKGEWADSVAALAHHLHQDSVLSEWRYSPIRQEAVEQGVTEEESNAGVDAAVTASRAARAQRP